MSGAKTIKTKSVGSPIDHKSDGPRILCRNRPVLDIQISELETHS